MAQQVTVIGGGALPANTAGGLAFQSAGTSGDAWVSELHGKFYSANRAGRLWSATALIAGVTIPVNTSTAATFGIYNPAGSGINVELVRFAVGTVAAGVATIGTFLATVSKQLPTSVTAAVNTVNPMNGGSPNATAFTVATFVASTQHIPLLSSFATSSQTAQVYDFDGMLILPPGWAMQVTSSPVQSAVNMPSLFWAEHPL
jgi:hypothetical protein